MHAEPKLRPARSIGHLVLAGTALLILAACQRNAQDANDEMAWARAALERNPNLEVVAADSRARVFTVRERRTGQVSALSLDQLAAAPISQLATVAPVVVPTPAESVAGSSPGEAEVTGPDASSEPTADESATAAGEAPAPVAEAKNYTVERSGNRVKISGPGVSIVTGGTAPATSAKGEPGQRAVDPIICEGRRVMHLDGREIYVEGDAITVRDGCELYITNSRIVASGTGLVVREGIVHVANSYLEGGRASFDAESDAKMYLQGSIFQGLSRRDTLAMIEDQGGNRGLPAL